MFILDVVDPAIVDAAVVDPVVVDVAIVDPAVVDATVVDPEVVDDVEDPFAKPIWLKDI